MSRRHYDLPPLTALAAFETAARHLSFKDAARELGVTPGAVSHQIKALEGELGRALFDRRHRGVELTPEGQALFESLSTAFRQVSRRLAELRDSAQTDAVVVGSTTAVSTLWLAPALIRFWRAFPQINVNQVTQDRPFHAAEKLDFFIRYGRDPDDALHHEEIYRDELVPVAAPRKAAELEGFGLADLAAQHLIHMDSASRSWTTWTDWFQELGFDGGLAKGSRVTSYAVALQIAGETSSVALGWRRLVAPLLEVGKLAVIPGHSLPAPRAFYLVSPKGPGLPPEARALRDWLMAEAHGRDTSSIHR
ncbi:MAG: LysR substrate-binding domain-containing protein [Silicimonas sp.]|nr:LysR substrate-binding domain-containing protein [Silicimonas sp.]